MVSDALARLTTPRWKAVGLVALSGSSTVVVAALLWAAITTGGTPDPTARHPSTGTVVVGAGILVFREGLETILVLTALMAGMAGSHSVNRRPIAAGGAVGLAATIATWFITVAVLNMINLPGLQLQAATGWPAIIVLLIVMNWFFHKVYWTGWIQTHTRRRRRLLSLGGDARRQVLLGLGMLGFFSIYREGFEVVLFLQNLRLSSSAATVLGGVLVGLYLSGTVAVLTFVLHRRLPYKKLLVATGIMLTAVLLVMVGEEINEMQLAGWMTTTPLASGFQFPGWAGTWFSLFANWETLVAMALAGLLVFGSYVVANYLKVVRPRRRGQQAAVRPEAEPSV